MELLTPETIEALGTLGALGAIVVVVVVIALLVRQVLGPFTAISNLLQTSQQQTAVGMSSLENVVKENTEVVRRVGTVIDNSLTASVIIRTQMERLTKEIEMDINAGIIVADKAGKVLRTNSLALQILGWSIDQLPGRPDAQTAPVVNVLDKTVPGSFWPMMRSVQTGNAIVNIPLRVYDFVRRTEKWIMVSAYPCTECQATKGETPSEWVTLILKEIGDLDRVG